MHYRPRALTRSIVLPACLALAGCRWLIPGDAADFLPVPADSIKTINLCPQGPCTDSLDIVSMGVGGYLFIPWRDTTHLALTPPAFRNPSIWRFVTGWDWIAGTSADTALVRRRLTRMRAAAPERLRRVRAILVGHAHYDHLMDLPAMAPWLPNARVYGSMTTVNLLAGAAGFRDSAGGRSRLVNIDSAAGYDATRPGEWTSIAASPLRFKAVAWQHARNFPGVTVATGDVWTPANGLPRTALGWKMGRIYAWALDILDAQGRIACRIIMQDAAASPRVVARANQVWAREAPAAVTVIVITAANFDRVDAYPDTLLSLRQPQHVVLGHWEEFYRTAEEPLRSVRGIVAPELVARVTAKVGDRWSALAPGATLRVVF